MTDRCLAGLRRHDELMTPKSSRFNSGRTTPVGNSGRLTPIGPMTPVSEARVRPHQPVVRLPGKVVEAKREELVMKDLEMKLDVGVGEGEDGDGEDEFGEFEEMDVEGEDESAKWWARV